MIRVLPPEVVNQIAAGEVVERPFSVVKELVENSLDAGATRIEVELDAGGRDRIVVLDDGRGFTPEDLELAFVSHATSKLAALADLDHIASLGFRGEALASIGSVSRATIRSRPADRDAGAEIECDGGRISAVRPCGTPPGTRIEIRDLFHNTPARRRFLRAPRAEKARIQDLLARLALPRLDVAFRLAHEGQDALVLPAGDDLATRIGRAFGHDLAARLAPVELVWGEYRVDGLIGRPEAARRDATQGLIFVNGRLAKDRATVQAVRQAYREYLMHGVHPVHFLMLWLPPSEVDVNVHPTKSEVRFVDVRKVCGLLHEAVAAGLAASGAAPKRGALGFERPGDKPRAVAGFPELPADLFGRPDAAPRPMLPPAPGRSRLVAGTAGEFAAEVRETPARPVATPATTATPAPVVDPSLAPAGPPAPADPTLTALAARRFLQVLDLYLVFESADGMVVVDQHALHERVLFERFRRRHAAAEQVPVQRLLVPEVVELPARDKDWLLSHAEELAAEGFLIEDFGGAAIAVAGVPAVLGRVRARAIVEQFLSGAEDDASPRPRAREAVVERFHTMACRAAIMAGDGLDESEIRALLVEAAGLEHPHNCPHGRPTVLTFSREELERFFKRRI